MIAYGSDPKDIDLMAASSFNQIQVDLTTTFTILIGIFFPSVTGKQCFLLPRASSSVLERLRAQSLRNR